MDWIFFTTGCISTGLLGFIVGAIFAYTHPAEEDET